jgi:hypothetical protein
MAKKKSRRVSQPSLGDVLLLHVPYDDWFLRKVYISEGGERGARLIDQDPNRSRLYKLGTSQAKRDKGRLLQLMKSEINGSKESNSWEVVADFLDD